jgi:hypothetical protein
MFEDKKGNASLCREPRDTPFAALLSLSFGNKSSEFVKRDSPKKFARISLPEGVFR